MADLPKINVAPALTMPLALSCKAYQALTQVLAKHQAADKISQLSEHSLVKKVKGHKEILLALVGLALILHGANFKNLLLCFQVIMAFLYERVKRTVVAVWSDVAVVREKMTADSPTQEPTTEATEDKSKHAKKREAKKDDKKANGAEKAKEDVETAKKVLKCLDLDKISAAGTEVLAAFLACILVVQGGLAQKVAISYALVGLIADRVEGVLDFPDHEDIQAWTRLLSRAAIWIVVLPLAVFFGPLALAMDAAALGARLVAEHGFEKLAQVNPSSTKGLAMAATLMAFGTLWQLWSWAADSGMAWYFQLLYLPAVLSEGLLSLLA